MEDYGCIIKSRSLHTGRYIFDVHYNPQPPLLRNQPHCQIIQCFTNHAPTVTFQTYTPKTLPPFDGKDGGQILLAIDDIVFHVTQGAGFMDLVRTCWNSLGIEAVQGVCMATLRAGTPLGAWRSSLLNLVLGALPLHSFPHSETLTPIDQPLDNLDDLRPDGMYVYPSDIYTSSDACSSAKTRKVGQVNVHNSSSLRLD